MAGLYDKLVGLFEPQINSIMDAKGIVGGSNRNGVSHVLGSALIAYDYGRDAAEIAGWAKEAFQTLARGNDYKDFKVDMYNDYLGMQLALEARLNNITRDQLIENVMVAHRAGRIANVDNKVPSLWGTLFGPRCFLAGTPILMADGTTKPIEAIRPGDEVAAFDPEAQWGLGPLKPGKVTRTFTNVTRTIINLRGLHMTPGHVVLMDNGEWDIIARALKDDRAIVEEREGPDGSCSHRNRLSPRNDGVGQVAGGPTMFSIKRSRLGRRSPVSGWRNPDSYARKPERIVTSTISRN